jgi:hypothetical protein
MAIWTIASVDAEPELALCGWRILEATYVEASEPATLHFVGCCAARSTGRVSTPIRMLDVKKRHGRTASGRVYELRGEPSTSREADYVWQAYADVNAVVSWRDVTREVLAAVEAHRFNSTQ